MLDDPPAARGHPGRESTVRRAHGRPERLAAFYPQLGDALKRRFAGWTAYFLTADLRLAKLIGLKATRRTPLYNGPLECRLFAFPLVAGSMREDAKAG